jgi:hypothetical protein
MQQKLKGGMIKKHTITDDVKRQRTKLFGITNNIKKKSSKNNLLKITDESEISDENNMIGQAVEIIPIEANESVIQTLIARKLKNDRKIM